MKSGKRILKLKIAEKEFLIVMFAGYGFSSGRQFCFDASAQIKFVYFIDLANKSKDQSAQSAVSVKQQWLWILFDLDFFFISTEFKNTSNKSGRKCYCLGNSLPGLFLIK